MMLIFYKFLIVIGIIMALSSFAAQSAFDIIALFIFGVVLFLIGIGLMTESRRGKEKKYGNRRRC